MVEKERATLEAITRNEGKPEQALRKIVEGRLNGFYKDICLLEQPYAKDDKVSISQLLGGAIDRPLRPGRDRLSRTRWSHSPEERAAVDLAVAAGRAQALR